MIEFRFGSEHRGPHDGNPVVFQTQAVTLDEAELTRLAAALNGKVVGKGEVERPVLREHCTAEVKDGALYVYDRTPGRTPNPHIICHRPDVERNRSTLHLLNLAAEELYDMQLCIHDDDKFFVH